MKETETPLEEGKMYSYMTGEVVDTQIGTQRPYAILAPNRLDDAALQSRIRELRENGDIVIEKLPEDNVASLEESFRLDEELVCINGVWTVAARTSNR